MVKFKRQNMMSDDEIAQYNKMMFMSEDAQQQYDALTPALKKTFDDMLINDIINADYKLHIQMIFNKLQEIETRISEIEKKLNENKTKNGY